MWRLSHWRELDVTAPDIKAKGSSCCTQSRQWFGTMHKDTVVVCAVFSFFAAAAAAAAAAAPAPAAAAAATTCDAAVVHAAVILIAACVSVVASIPPPLSAGVIHHGAAEFLLGLSRVAKECFRCRLRRACLGGRTAQQVQCAVDVAGKIVVGALHSSAVEFLNVAAGSASLAEFLSHHVPAASLLSFLATTT